MPLFFKILIALAITLDVAFIIILIIVLLSLRKPNSIDFIGILLANFIGLEDDDEE